MRSQCESETMHENAANKFGKASTWVGRAAIVVTPKNPILGAVLEGVSQALGEAANAAEAKRSRLEEGCKLEIQQNTQRPNGQGGSGGGGGTAYLEGHNTLDCSEMYVASPNQDHGDNDQIFVNGGTYVTMCVPSYLTWTATVSSTGL